MTNQEVFDKVTRHLLAQKMRSVTPRKGELGGYMCAYRGEEGRMCAIGCLIPDSEYREEFEGMSAVPVCSQARSLTYVNSGFALELQRIHDHADPECWKLRLTQLGSKHKLDTAVLGEFE